MKTKMIQFANKIQCSRSRIFLYFVSNKNNKNKEQHLCREYNDARRPYKKNSCKESGQKSIWPI